MPTRYLLKLNFLAFICEVYIIAALLFDFKVPGSNYFVHDASIRLSLSLLPLALTLLSKRVEGWTIITVPTLLCSLLIPSAAVMHGMAKLSVASLAALLAVAHANSIVLFPVMKLYKSTGPFSVGYRSYDGEDQFKYCVFYPTLHPTKKHPALISDASAMRKYHEASMGRSGDFPPRWCFELLMHIYTKVRLFVGIDSPLASPEELKEKINNDKMIPVIFSHGLGAGRNNYVSLLSQLASRGYFVISLDHNDEVKSIFQGTLENAQKYLGYRVKDMQRVVSELTNMSGSITELFGKEINLDMSRLTVMGHSYGGPTSYLVAWGDERVKNCVLLDPWLYPVQRESLEKKLDCNILIFESEDWSDMYPEMATHDRDIQVVEAQKGSKGGAFYCRIPESQHNHFSDDFLVVGGVYKYTKVIKNIEVAKKVYESTIKAIDDFFRLVVAKPEGKENFDEFAEIYKDDKRFPLVRY